MLLKKTHIPLLCIFSIFWGFFTTNTAFAEHSCQIAWGPISEFSEYQTSLREELQTIISKANSNPQNNECSPIKQKSSLVFDIANAELRAMSGFVADFNYNFQYALKGDKNTAVKRDGKIFETFEKQVQSTAEQLANNCKLDNASRKSLSEITKEIYSLKRLYQQTAIGNVPTDFSGIRESNYALARGITGAYSPSQTASCIPNPQNNKSFGETLKNALNLGAKTEDALSTWRRGAALIRGWWYGMTPSEYTNIQRWLLSAELSRQGISTNAKNVILRNFDCYKSKISETSGTPEDIISARIACLSAPFAGAEKVFEMGENFGDTIKSWKNFVWSAKSSDDLIIRDNEKNRRKVRTFSVIEMHSNLNALVKSDQSNNANNLKNLVDWHLSLQMTNELLENRIKPMQSNCMKWQPDIEGGCRN